MFLLFISLIISLTVCYIKLPKNVADSIEMDVFFRVVSVYILQFIYFIFLLFNIRTIFGFFYQFACSFAFVCVCGCEVFGFTNQFIWMDIIDFISFFRLRDLMILIRCSNWRYSKIAYLDNKKMIFIFFLFLLFLVTYFLTWENEKKSVLVIDWQYRK